MVDFLFAKIELFSCLLQLRRYKLKSVEIDIFKGVGHFVNKFQMEGAVAHQPLLVSENQSDCLSHGIKISAVHCVVLFQSLRMTVGQNYDSQDHASIAALHSKNVVFVVLKASILD